MRGRRMIYTGLHEAFLTYLKLSFFAALFSHDDMTTASGKAALSCQLQNTAGGIRCYVSVLAELDQVVFLQLFHNGINGRGFDRIIAQAGWSAHLLKEMPRCLNGCINQLIFIAVLQVPDPAAVLQ